jgi:hypothetical protein
MNRHSFRWEALVFGLFFLAVVGTWTVWKAGLLDSDQLAYAAAGALIVLGVVGIAASIAGPRKLPAAPSTDEEVPDVREETDSQP